MGAFRRVLQGWRGGRCYFLRRHAEQVPRRHFVGEDLGVWSCIPRRIVSLFVALMIVGVFWGVVAKGRGGPHGFTVWRQKKPVLGTAGV